MIDKIYNAGDDALANLFNMAIDPIPFIDLEPTIVRVQNVTIPSTGATTYEVSYKGHTITKPGGKVEVPNEFTFDIRIDRNYYIYKGLVAWKNAVADSASGIIGPDGPANNNRVNITVWGVDPDDDPLPDFGEWKFKGCFVQNIGDVGLDYTSGDPIVVTVTMGFLTLDDSGL